MKRKVYKPIKTTYKNSNKHDVKIVVAKLAGLVRIQTARLTFAPSDENCEVCRPVPRVTCDFLCTGLHKSYSFETVILHYVNRPRLHGSIVIIILK